MSNNDEGARIPSREKLEGAAADLLPLVLDILGLSGRMRGLGLAQLPEHARSFFLVAACMGIVKYFEAEVVDSESQLAPARELAPIIATQLRQFALKLPPAPNKN